MATTATNPDWSRDEHIMAFNLYCKMPYGKMHHRNPDVIKLAQLLNRTPGAVSRKLSNFARLDPTLQKRSIKGLEHGAKGEVAVWEEFNGKWEELAIESAQLLAARKNTPLENTISLSPDDFQEMETEREQLVKIRIKQDFFRSSVLAAYDFKCCITSLNIPQLLIASHIVPWSRDKKNRVNPQNGLCLNAFHDKAFDRGFMTILTDLRIKVSSRLLKKKPTDTIDKFLTSYHGATIDLPRHFLPKVEFLDYHNRNIFED